MLNTSEFLNKNYFKIYRFLFVNNNVHVTEYDSVHSCLDYISVLVYNVYARYRSSVRVDLILMILSCFADVHSPLYVCDLLFIGYRENVMPF